MNTSPQPETKREAWILLACWVTLIALTIASFGFAEGHDDTDGPRAATAALVLGLAAIKAHLIAGLYMELLRAPRAWAIAMSAYLVALATLLVFLFR